MLADLGAGGDAAEDAVDKLASVGAAEGLGQLDRLVDGRLEGNAGQVENLEAGDSQQGALHFGHLVEAPVTGGLLELGIDLGLVVANALDQGAGEIRRFGIGPRLGDMVLERSFYTSTVILELEEHLERELAGQVAAAH